MIKNKCVACGYPLEGTIEYYERMGNFCLTCSHEAGNTKRKCSIEEYLIVRIREVRNGTAKDLMKNF